REEVAGGRGKDSGSRKNCAENPCYRIEWNDDFLTPELIGIVFHHDGRNRERALFPTAIDRGKHARYRGTDSEPDRRRSKREPHLKPLLNARTNLPCQAYFVLKHSMVANEKVPYFSRGHTDDIYPPIDFNGRYHQGFPSRQC